MQRRSRKIISFSKAEQKTWLGHRNSLLILWVMFHELKLALEKFIDFFTLRCWWEKCHKKAFTYILVNRCVRATEKDESILIDYGHTVPFFKGLLAWRWTYSSIKIYHSMSQDLDAKRFRKWFFAQGPIWVHTCLKRVVSFFLKLLCA